MKQNQIHNALHKASHETTRLVSAHLRTEAHASNWPEHVANSLGVSYNKDGFEVHVHDKHHAAALDAEYGTTSTQPNPAIRKTANRTGEAESFFVSRLYKHLEAHL